MTFGAWLTFDVLLLLLALLAAVAVSTIVAAVRRGGRREDPVEDDVVAASRFTLPVSIIVPLEPEARGLPGTIRSLLALNYPEFEVIVVADRFADAELQVVGGEWKLSPKEYFYRRSVETSNVRRIYDSARDPRLIVVDKERASRADALNCGLSLARFRYVATLAPGVVVDAQALLRLMAPALRDPVAVLAATSHVERQWHPAAAGTARGVLSRCWKTVEGDWQRISSLRAWLTTRLALGRLRSGLAPQDAVVVWRRDMVVESGGFSDAASDPELDLQLRLLSMHGQVVRTGEIVGKVDTIGLRMSARRDRTRQRAVVEAASTLRTSQRRRDGQIATIAFVAAEFLTPVVQAAAIFAVIGGAIVGWFSATNVVLLVVMLAFGNAAVGVAALLVRGAFPGAPAGKELTRLLLLAPAEYLLYRPLVAIARLGRTSSAS